MSGKPAARQGDMTQYGGSIVQGSAGVRIGAPTGVACSGILSTCFPVRTVTAAASHCGWCAAAWRNWMKVTGWPHSGRRCRKNSA
ncbi:hypothetical protein C5P13_19385 [Escherichia coli]|nr:hypothetical protein C5P13_19385 [Escherichia coli]